VASTASESTLGIGGVELPPGRWAGYLCTLSVVYGSMATRVRSLAAESRVDPLVRPMRLEGLRFDEEADLLEVALRASAGSSPALRCYVRRPRRLVAREHEAFHTIVVVEESGAATSIEISRAES
jgi:hypothetical protein